MEKSTPYRTSEYNNLPEVRASYQIPHEVYLVDSTLRSLQSGVSGGSHTPQDLVEIGKALDGLGVRKLILNLRWQQGTKVCEGLAQENLQSKIVVAVRGHDPAWQTWADQGMRAGADEICFVSIKDEDHLERVADYCHRLGGNVSHEFTDTYSYAQMVSLCRKSVRCHYQSQGFHDSFNFFRFGITPEAVKHFVSTLRRDVPDLPPMYVHFSNVFGNATMTAAAAVIAGATAPDVSMNGIGHHSGHTSLEEVVMVLECLYGIRTGIKLEKICEVSRFVQDRTGIPVPAMKPIVGRHAFLIDAYFRSNEAAFPEEKKNHDIFPFPPAMIGSQDRLIWSHRQTFPENVRWKLASMAVSYQEHHVQTILATLEEVLRKREAYPNWLTDIEFEEICRKVIQGQKA